jgi:hypothetical protein
MAKSKLKPAIVIEPSGEVRELEIAGDLASLQGLVGGYIEPVPYQGSGNTPAYVNEEGLINGLPHNPRGAAALAKLGRRDLHYLRGPIVFIHPKPRVKEAIGA